MKENKSKAYDVNEKIFRCRSKHFPIITESQSSNRPTENNDGDNLLVTNNHNEKHIVILCSGLEFYLC